VKPSPRLFFVPRETSEHAGGQARTLQKSIQSELPSHLNVRVRKVMTFARVYPRLQLGGELFLVCHPWSLHRLGTRRILSRNATGEPQGYRTWATMLIMPTVLHNILAPEWGQTGVFMIALGVCVVMYSVLAAVEADSGIAV
jgi:hypothetical protein